MKHNSLVNTILCGALISLSYGSLFSAPKRQTPPPYPDSTSTKELDPNHPEELAILMDRASKGNMESLFILAFTKGEVFMKRNFPDCYGVQQPVQPCVKRHYEPSQIQWLETRALDYDYDAIQELISEDTDIVLQNDAPKFVWFIKNLEYQAVENNHMTAIFRLSSLFNEAELQKYAPRFYEKNKESFEKQKEEYQLDNHYRARWS